MSCLNQRWTSLGEMDGCSSSTITLFEPPLETLSRRVVVGWGSLLARPRRTRQVGHGLGWLLWVWSGAASTRVIGGGSPRCSTAGWGMGSDHPSIRLLCTHLLDYTVNNNSCSSSCLKASRASPLKKRGKMERWSGRGRLQHARVKRAGRDSGTG